MGLPLFIAPVDSDIPQKAAAKSPINATYGRSPIRRDSPAGVRSRRRQVQEAREHRFRMLATLQGEEESLLAPSRRDSTNESVPAGSNAGVGAMLDASLRSRERNFQRLVEDAERERQASVESTSQLEHLDSVLQHPDWTQIGHTGPRHYSAWARERGLSERTGSARARLADLQAPSSSLYYYPYRADHGWEPRITSAERLRHRRSNPPVHARSFPRFGRNGQRPSHNDGLGDRDRSLSPEGDGVWHTLQSTLTPDPQPPSASSSFASTSASTAASQRSAPVSSVNTSMTSPDELAEPPCDPVADDSDLNDSGDEALEQILAQRLAGSSGRSNSDSNRRSYADVAADLSLDTAPSADASSDWLTGLHRIVRGLASREDIPDEWWAEAGLSRSMREDSN
ncbi:hypothetical protein Micbo1qcDRAFT_167285 [Microdochium bolleyi]|uniref:Uncharacterized protein n=1 Tax=Microdochium bolleyi TaxID=196109 RepID=A0A136ISE6_9PEZI|nr:hypothetical protein Micbo1qcDRAFT_167285 [Microdochium bolleyi]